jgi:hypothetical protein
MLSNEIFNVKNTPSFYVYEKKALLLWVLSFHIGEKSLLIDFFKFESTFQIV